MHTNKILKIVMIGLMAGLCYISFMFFQIKIPTPGGFTSFHLGNTFCVLAALLLGGLEGGLAGAIGMGIADLLDPTYAIVAPKTMILGEPVFSYFYTAFVLGSPHDAAAALASWNAITTAVNAILAIVISSILYINIQPRLKNNGILKKLAVKE